MRMGVYPGNVMEDDLQYSHMFMRWIQDVHGHIQRNRDPSGWKQDCQNRKQDCSEALEYAYYYSRVAIIAIRGEGQTKPLKLVAS